MFGDLGRLVKRGAREARDQVSGALLAPMMPGLESAARQGGAAMDGAFDADSIDQRNRETAARREERIGRDEVAKRRRRRGNSLLTGDVAQLGQQAQQKGSLLTSISDATNNLLG